VHRPIKAQRRVGGVQVAVPELAIRHMLAPGKKKIMVHAVHGGLPPIRTGTGTTAATTTTFTGDATTADATAATTATATATVTAAAPAAVADC